mgnify:CR=1 FL=1
MHGVRGSTQRAHYHAQAGHISSRQNSHGKYKKGLASPDQREAAKKAASFTHAQFGALMEEKAAERKAVV